MKAKEEMEATKVNDNSLSENVSESDQKSANSSQKGKTVQLIGEQNPRYKTKRCKNWEETSDCPYGKKCQFAHGDEELRAAQAANLENESAVSNNANTKINNPNKTGKRHQHSKNTNKSVFSEDVSHSLDREGDSEEKYQEENTSYLYSTFGNYKSQMYANHEMNVSPVFYNESGFLYNHSNAIPPFQKSGDVFLPNHTSTREDLIYFAGSHQDHQHEQGNYEYQYFTPGRVSRLRTSSLPDVFEKDYYYSGDQPFFHSNQCVDNFYPSEFSFGEGKHDLHFGVPNCSISSHERYASEYNETRKPVQREYRNSIDSNSSDSTACSDPALELVDEMTEKNDFAQTKDQVPEEIESIWPKSQRRTPKHYRRASDSSIWQTQESLFSFPVDIHRESDLANIKFDLIRDVDESEKFGLNDLFVSPTFEFHTPT